MLYIQESSSPIWRQCLFCCFQVWVTHTHSVTVSKEPSVRHDWGVDLCSCETWSNDMSSKSRDSSGLPAACCLLPHFASTFLTSDHIHMTSLDPVNSRSTRVRALPRYGSFMVYPSICLPVCLPVCLPITIYLSTCPSVHQSIYPSNI